MVIIVFVYTDVAGVHGGGEGDEANKSASLCYRNSHHHSCSARV